MMEMASGAAADEAESSRDSDSTSSLSAAELTAKDSAPGSFKPNPEPEAHAQRPRRHERSKDASREEAREEDDDSEGEEFGDDEKNGQRSDREASLSSKSCRWGACTRQFATATLAREHEKTDHVQQGGTRCEIAGCGKVFSHHQKLTRHFVAHGERQFGCEYCGNRFFYRWDLKRHTFLHTGQKPYRCPEDGCLKSFTKQMNCELHLMNDHGKSKSAAARGSQQSAQKRQQEARSSGRGPKARAASRKKSRKEQDTSSEEDDDDEENFDDEEEDIDHAEAVPPKSSRSGARKAMPKQAWKVASLDSSIASSNSVPSEGEQQVEEKEAEYLSGVPNKLQHAVLQPQSPQYLPPMPCFPGAGAMSPLLPMMAPHHLPAGFMGHPMVPHLGANVFHQQPPAMMPGAGQAPGLLMMSPGGMQGPPPYMYLSPRAMGSGPTTMPGPPPVYPGYGAAVQMQGPVVNRNEGGFGAYSMPMQGHRPMYHPGRPFS